MNKLSNFAQFVLEKFNELSTTPGKLVVHNEGGQVFFSIECLVPIRYSTGKVDVHPLSIVRMRSVIRFSMKRTPARFKAVEVHYGMYSQGGKKERIFESLSKRSASEVVEDIFLNAPGFRKTVFDVIVESIDKDS